MLENTELKKKIAKLEEEKLDLKQTLITIDRGGLTSNSLDMNEMY